MAMFSREQTMMAVQVGGAAAVTLVVTDFFVNRQWTAAADEQNRDYYRAGAQLAAGVAGYLILRKWNRRLAVGVAMGGIIGMGIRMADKWDVNATLNRWFPERTASGYRAMNRGASAGAPAGLPEGKVVFYDEPANVNRRASA